MASRRSAMANGSAAQVTSGNLTVPLGTEGVDWVAGDLAVIAISYRDTAQFSAPGGWSIIAQDASPSDTLSSDGTGGAALATRQLQSGDGNPTFTRSGGGLAEGVRAIYKPDSGGAVSVYAHTLQDNTGAAEDTTADFPSVTPVGAGDVLLLVAFIPDNISTGSPSGTTPSVSPFHETVSTTNEDCSIMLADGTFTSGSASGARTASTSDSCFDKTAGLVITESAADCIVSGDVVPTIDEAAIQAGGAEIILTLQGSFLWVAGGSFDDTVKQAIIDGLDSDGSEGTGWNAEVRDAIATSTVVRTSDTVVTITLPVLGSYEITALETITVTVPAAALQAGGPLTAGPTFSVYPHWDGPLLHGWEENASSGAATSVVITKPGASSPNAGIGGLKAPAVGDLLVIVVGSDDNTATAQWDDSTLKPTGFTLVNEVGDNTRDCHCAAFVRVVDGTEGPSFSVPAQSSDDLFVACFLLSNVDPAAPVNATGADSVTNNATSGSPLSMDEVTTSVALCLGLFISALDGADDGGYTVGGTGWEKGTELRNGTGSGNASGCWGQKQIAGAGVSAAATVYPAVSDGMVGFQFAIAPNPGGGDIEAEPLPATAAWTAATPAAVLGAVTKQPATAVASWLAMVGAVTLGGIAAQPATAAASWTAAAPAVVLGARAAQPDPAVGAWSAAAPAAVLGAIAAEPGGAVGSWTAAVASVALMLTADSDPAVGTWSVAAGAYTVVTQLEPYPAVAHFAPAPADIMRGFGDFEDPTLPGMQVANGTITYDVTHVDHGTGAMLFTRPGPPNATSVNCRLLDGVSYYPVVGGVPYRLQVRLYAEAAAVGKTINFLLYLRQGLSVVHGVSSGRVLTLGWQTHTLDNPGHADADGAQVDIFCSTTSPAVQVWIDDLKVLRTDEPTVVLGAVAKEPASAVGTWAAATPTVVFGTIAAQPASAAATWAAATPAAVLGGISAQPATATASWAAAAPAAVLGAITPEPLGAVGTWTVMVGALQPALAAEPAPAIGTWTAATPAVVLGAISAQPASAASSWAAASPTVLLGAVTAQPATPVGTWGAASPAVVLGAIAAEPGSAVGAWSAAAPAAVLGAIAAQPAAAVGTWTAMTGAAIIGGQLAEPLPAVGSWSAATPAVVLGAVAAEPLAAVGTWTAAVGAALTGYAAEPIPAVGAWSAAQPAAVLGPLAATPATATAAWAAATPSVIFGAITAQPGSAAGAWGVMTGAAQQLLAAAPLPAAATWVVSSPTAVLTLAAQPVPAVGSWTVAAGAWAMVRHIVLAAQPAAYTVTALPASLFHDEEAEAILPLDMPLDATPVVAGAVVPTAGPVDVALPLSPAPVAVAIPLSPVVELQMPLHVST